MAGFLYKGILLQQMKEPALSHDLREFVNADTIGARLDIQQPADLQTLASGEIINIARCAAIVDERDGGLLADKLLRAYRRVPHLLVADAIDDEPYISSQINPLLKNQELAATGLTLAQRACGAAQAMFAVYKNLTDLDIRIPHRIGAFDVERIRGRYPAEFQASQHYEEDDGVLVIGAGALLHLARAVLFCRPQTTAFITVAGNCIGTPTNLEVSLGMTVSQVLERCGLIDEPNRVVIGGSMTGISVMDTDNTLITPTTRAVLAFRQDVRTRGFECIGCSRCVHVCPAGLNPFYLYRNIIYGRFAMFDAFDGRDCFNCGTCSYMCPAKLNLSDTISSAGEKYADMLDSMQKNRDDYALYRHAAYERYMGNYLLGKAIRTHGRQLKAILKKLRRDLSKAAGDYKAEQNSLDNQLSDARKTLKAQNETAERLLGAALAALQGDSNAADQKLVESLSAMRSEQRAISQDLANALEAMHGAEKAAERTLAEAKAKLSREENEADQQLSQARKQMNAALAKADRDYQLACRSRDASDKSCDRTVAEAKKLYAQTCRDAERTQSETEKEQEQLRQRTVEEAEKELALLQKSGADDKAVKAKQQSIKTIKASAQKLCDQACAKARETCEREKDSAKIALERVMSRSEEDKNSAVKRVQSALMACSKSKESAKAALAAAKKQNLAQKENAKLVYKQAEQTYAKSKQAARALYEQAQLDCTQKKQDAQQRQSQAEKACEHQKENGTVAYSHAQADCDASKEQAAAAFELRRQEIEKLRVKAQAAYEQTEAAIRQQADADRQQIDRQLTRSRTEAFLSARAAAVAKASLYRRRPSLEDFDMPSFASACELALQNNAARLAQADDGEQTELDDGLRLSSQSAVVLEIQELLRGWPRKITYTGQTVHAFSAGGQKI